LLHQRLDHDGGRADRSQSQAYGCADQGCVEGPHLPLRHPCRRHPRREARHPAGLRRRAMTNMTDATHTGDSSLTRRAFLSTSGALVVSLATPGEWGEASANTQATRPPLKGDQLSSYITIEPDGSVVAYYGKIDGGQGLGTSIAQMVAEEIDVAFERVKVVMGDSGLTLDMGGASAAIGVSHGGTMLRRTAAETRRLLVEM